VRSGDTEADLLRKIKHATFLGTLQSTLTEFKFLSPEWVINCEEERLLGVSLTGIQDHRILGRWSTGIVKDDTLTELLLGMKRHAATNNRRVARKLGIEPSAAITCVKPSGTVSQLCNTASGIHPRYAEYYIRRVVADNKDPLCEFMKNHGFPWEPSVSNEYATVFSFPVASPKGAITRHDLSAIDQLDLWRMYNEAYCEHKPSITVYYKDEEFPEVMSYVWNNFDEMSGVSFLPSGDDHIYTQAPYEEITEAKYKQLLKAMPKNVDWQGLSVYENEDSTSVQPELACHGGACEL
jgi:ribonucleoside-diphosphate reductase alpha chain